MDKKTQSQSEEGDLTEALFKEGEIYKPSKDVLEKANLKNYDETVKYAKENPEKFWEEAAEKLEWFKKWNKVFDPSNKPFYKWFIGGKCNIIQNALDKHLKTKGNKTAIIWENERGVSRKLTYSELSKEVNKLANALKTLGISRGDRIAIYLPNIPEIAISMLASAKIGAVHSVVYAGYSAGALAERINDAEAKILITADVGYRRGKIIKLKDVVDEAVRKCPVLEKVIVVKRSNEEINIGEKDIFYDKIVEKESDECETEIMDAEDPLFILYTSGTTAKPKGVVHVHGGYMVGVARTINWVFDLKEDDIYWCTANPGWITGHSYIVYGPLMAGVTTLMYEGVPDWPKPDKIWQVVEKYKVSVFYTAPTLIRAMMKYGDEWPKRHSLSSLRLLGSVGEPINPEAWKWYYKIIGESRCPIMDTWWQTETGMIMITPLPVVPLKAGSATFPFPGIEADVVDKNGKTVPLGKGGFLVIKNQWPAMLRNVFKNPKRYRETYWEKIPGYYATGDLAAKDKDGYFWIQGRTDDVLNISGHRIGSAEIESALVTHEAVVEAGVIGKPDPIKGETAKGFVILKEGYKESQELVQAIKLQVRKTLGPIAVISEISFVDKLPKTRSGKIMRRVLRAKELGLPVGDVSGLAD